ncbi:MAG: tetratricopeptide repeat protein [Chloroflexaceae bacterium]
MPGDTHLDLASLAGAARDTDGTAALTWAVEHLFRVAGAETAEALRRAALPRWFDIEVLHSLCEPSLAPERLFEQARALSFVRDLGDGRLTYADQVRQVLLADWRRDRPDDLEALHWRLYHHFAQRAVPADTASGAMPLLPESTALSAAPLTVQADLVRREALYHLLHVDPERGLDELRATFAYFEAIHRLAELERLAQMASAAIADAVLGSRQRRWAQYLRARALLAARRLDEAIPHLEALRAYEDLEPDLAAQVGQSLGEACLELGRYALAIKALRPSLALAARIGEQPALARTMLLLGDAYHGLGADAWHVPTPSPHLALRLGSTLWIGLLSLPFLVATLALGPGNRLLPRPAYCAHHQNWLSIRLINTARFWYTQARDTFRYLEDARGVVNAEQRLADTLLHYGYHNEARTAIEELLQQPVARDPYLRATLHQALAECSLAANNAAAARASLAAILVFFRDLGDVQRETRVLATCGHAARLTGDIAGALGYFSAGLERARTLPDPQPRERILRLVRAWRSDPRADAETRRALDRLLAAEPEKHYTTHGLARYVGLLPVTAVLTLPLLVLLIAAVAPVQQITPHPDGLIALGSYFHPWRALGVVATLLPITLAVYAAVAAAVLYWLPLTRIERTLSDVIAIRPGAIARYDAWGNLRVELPWSAVRRWLTFDCRLWDRPLGLISRSALESAPDRALPIEGSASWYTEVQQEIERHLERAHAPPNLPVERQELGPNLLRSLSGLSIGVGLVLLLLVACLNNGWLPLGVGVPLPIVAAVWFLALSGALILAPLGLWIAGRSLHLPPSLQVSRNWPWVVAGIGGANILLALAGGQWLIRVEALTYTLVVWGTYLLAEALAALIRPGQLLPRLGAVVVAVGLALALVAAPALNHFRWLERSIAHLQALNGVEAAARVCAITPTAAKLATPGERVYLFQGDCAARLGDWSTAARAYAGATRAAPEGSSRQALAFYNLGVAAGYLGAADTLDQAIDAYEQICATLTRSDPICAQLQAVGPPRLRR